VGWHTLFSKISGTGHQHATYFRNPDCMLVGTKNNAGDGVRFAPLSHHKKSGFFEQRNPIAL
jgi:hypothetical protein